MTIVSSDSDNQPIRVRRWPLFFACLFAVASFVSGYVALSGRSITVGLVADARIKHLGELTQGSTVPCEFQLTNEFPEEIEIVNVVKSCGGCTEVEVLNRQLAPGAQSRVRAIWKTGGSRGNTGFNLWVIFRLRGQRDGSIQLRVEGHVIPDIDFDPPRLVFGPGRDASQVVSLRPGRMAEFKIRRVYTNHRAFKAMLRAGTTAVEIQFDPREWPDDQDRAVLTVETSSPNEPAIRVELRTDRRIASPTG